MGCRGERAPRHPGLDSPLLGEEEGPWRILTAENRFADNFPKTKSEDIQAGEFLLCQGIRFSFDVRHPFRALQGAAMELLNYGDIEVSSLPSSITKLLANT